MKLSFNSEHKEMHTNQLLVFLSVSVFWAFFLCFLVPFSVSILVHDFLFSFSYKEEFTIFLAKLLNRGKANEMEMAVRESLLSVRM